MPCRARKLASVQSGTCVHVCVWVYQCKEGYKCCDHAVQGTQASLCTHVPDPHTVLLCVHACFVQEDIHGHTRRAPILASIQCLRLCALQEMNGIVVHLSCVGLCAVQKINGIVVHLSCVGLCALQ